MVEPGLRLTYSIIVIAGLRFLGFGLQPPTAELGPDDQREPDRIAANPWAVLVPALLIAVLTIGMNTVHRRDRPDRSVGRRADDAVCGRLVAGADSDRHGGRGADAASGPGRMRLSVEDLQVLRAPSRGWASADVVDEVSFRVRPGELSASSASPGSGKTTWRWHCSVTPAAAWSLRRLGRRRRAGHPAAVTGAAAAERGRQVAYVPQDPCQRAEPRAADRRAREVLAAYEADGRRAPSG